MKKRSIMSKALALLMAALITLAFMPAAALAANQIGESTEIKFNDMNDGDTMRVSVGSSTNLLAYAFGAEQYSDENQLNKDNPTKGLVTFELANPEDAEYVAVKPVGQAKNKGLQCPFEILKKSDHLVPLTFKAKDKPSVTGTIKIQTTETFLTVKYGKKVREFAKDELDGEGVLAKKIVTGKTYTGRNHYYLDINKIENAEGIYLEDFIDIFCAENEIDKNSFADDQLITAEPPDKRVGVFTVKELLREDRYYFSRATDDDCKEGAAGGYDLWKGSIPAKAFVCIGNNDSRLVFGQVAPNERNIANSVKYLATGGTIEILDQKAEKLSCDVQADKASGSTLAPGTEVVLSSATLDDTEIYYTTDGSEPAKETASIYNYKTQTSKTDKSDVKKNAVIKAPETEGTFVLKVRQTSYGSLDSDVKTFTYKVEIPVVKGRSYTVGGQKYKATKVASDTAAGTVTFTKAKNAKNAVVPQTVKLADGKTYKVTGIGAKAFSGKKIRTVTVKTKDLKKNTVKKCLKGSKVKTVKVKVGAKKLNKKYVKKYKKFFTKKNAGKKVKVK